MKLILAMLLFTGTATASSDDGKTGILTAVDEGIKAESEMTAAAVSRNQTQDDETRLIYWDAMRDARGRMETAYDRAIKLTNDAYDLSTPPTTDPKVAPPSSPDGGWAAGLPAPRSVTFMPPNYRAIKDSGGSLHYISDNPADNGEDGTMALTDPDGQTTLFSQVMEIAAETREPGVLALTLDHENRHYRELITTGWDTHEQMEIRAFTETLNMVDSFIPESNPDLREAIKISIAGVIAANDAALRAGNIHSPFPSKEQERYNREAFEKQEADEHEYKSLTQRVGQLRRERRQRQAAAEKDLRWQKFKIWTLYACSYINGVHEGDTEWGHPDMIRARDEAYRNYLRSGLVVMAKDEIDAGLRRNDLLHAGDLGRCHRQMVEMIRDLPGPADEDWLMDRIEYDRRGGRAGEIIGGLLEFVRRSVADGTAAIVRVVSAPFTGDRSTGSDSRGADHGTHMPDIDKLPWRQLRGIASRGWD
jgi:hypothetical protein